MSDNDTSKYRSMLISQYHTGVKLIMDEVEDEVNRILDFAKSIDTTDKEAMTTGIGTIVNALKELARKVY